MASTGSLSSTSKAVTTRDVATLLNVTTIESAKRSKTRIQTLSWKTGDLLEIITATDADGTVHTMTRIDKGSTHVVVVPTDLSGTHVLIPSTLDMTSSLTTHTIESAALATWTAHPGEPSIIDHPRPTHKSAKGLHDNAVDIHIHMSKPAAKALLAITSIAIILLALGALVGYRLGKRNRIEPRPWTLSSRSVPHEPTATATQQRIAAAAHANSASGNSRGTARRAAEEGRRPKSARFADEAAGAGSNGAVAAEESSSGIEKGADTAGSSSSSSSATKDPAGTNSTGGGVVVVTETSNDGVEKASSAPTSTAGAKPAGVATTTAGTAASTPAVKEKEVVVTKDAPNHTDGASDHHTGSQIQDVGSLRGRKRFL